MQAAGRDAALNPKKKETLETAHDVFTQKVKENRDNASKARKAQPMVDLVDVKILKDIRRVLRRKYASR